MKKFIFAAAMISFLSVSAKNFNEKNDVNPVTYETMVSDEVPAGWVKWLIEAVKVLIGGGDEGGGGIEVQKGTNKVVNGQRFECIDGGLCYVKTGSATTKANTTLSSVRQGQNALLQDANGLYALLITKEEAKSNKDFNLADGYYMIPQDFSFSTVAGLPKDFQALTIKANVKYNLQELPYHYAIIIK